jgi:ribonuclease HII
MLKLRYQKNVLEAGCDEAGRGAMAGPVFAAAVILPKTFRNSLLNDSKKLSEKDRYLLRPVIEKKAVAWAVGVADHEEIDSVNILNATFLAMHRAIAKLDIAPEFLLIDGPHFRNRTTLQYCCIIDGDALYAAIAAASVLAKTYRDDYMKALHSQFPHYNWKQNKGYGTEEHRNAMLESGLSTFHRKSFHLKDHQMKLELDKEALPYEHDFVDK